MESRPIQTARLILLPAVVLALCYFLTAPSQAPLYIAQNASESQSPLPALSSPSASAPARFVILHNSASLSATLLQEYDGGVGQGYLLNLFRRMADSSWSVGLHESRYAYDLIESVHVWTLCLFFGLAVMFDFRLLGWTMRDVPVSEVARRLLPWTAAGFVVMVISGTLLFSAIPLRSYQNIFFRTKMVMLMFAGINVWIFHSGIYRRVTNWDLDRVPPKAAKAAGVLSLVLWVCIVLSGRMIAYNWFDCDRQPQPAIINLLTSCVPGPAQAGR
jgi:uncharacterized protein DUF6644